MQPPSPINDPIKPLLSPIIVLAWSREAAVGEQRAVYLPPPPSHIPTQGPHFYTTQDTVRILEMMHINNSFGKNFLAEKKARKDF